MDASNRISLKIKDYGPLKDGTSKLPGGVIEFPKYTILIGDQGTGKSTVAKLFSSFSWLEKAFVRQYYDDKKFELKDFQTLLENQNLSESYITDSTVIEYSGQTFVFSLSDKKFKIKRKISASYVCPQILYVPSERNILSVVDNFWDVKGLPEMVNQLAGEFLNANRKIGRRRRRLFPDYTIQFDPETQMSYVDDDSGKSHIFLSQASSGLQSIAPLIVVTDYFAKELKDDFFEKLKNESINIKKVASKALAGDDLELKLNNFFASGIMNDFSKKDIEILKGKLSPFVNSCFWEIVEEPEQNLYPTSQVAIVKILIENTMSQNSKLVMTTHSPYILSAMNNFIFANDQFKEYQKTVRGIPKKYFINFDEVSAYKIENGSIRSIMDHETKMIDVSEIDGCSEEINSVFDRLFNLGK